VFVLISGDSNLKVTYIVCKKKDRKLSRSGDKGEEHWVVEGCEIKKRVTIKRDKIFLSSDERGSAAKAAKLFKETEKEGKGKKK
jgi:hypothetical protein